MEGKGNVRKSNDNNIKHIWKYNEEVK